MSVSPFYDALKGAQEFILLYPVRSGESVGPHWLDDGIPFTGDYDGEPILAVPLGGARYRLAERCGGPFSCCLLRWGGMSLRRMQRATRLPCAVSSCLRRISTISG